MSDLGEQAHGTLHDVIDVDGLRQERLEGVALRPTHGLEFGEAVDEHAVATVSRDAPGGGVRLVDEASFLQHRHVIADRRR